MSLAASLPEDKPADQRGKRENSKGGYDFSQSQSDVEGITAKKFDFGPPRGSQPVNVDQTLAKLFDTLSVECSGILVHPQWHHFRHIRMLKNDQIRLSNGIWRSWHLQFQKRRRPLYCRFDIEGELDHHKRQEAVVLEGKYWKRKVGAVASEYRKWRYYREKNVKKKQTPAAIELREKVQAVFEELVSEVKRKPQEMQVVDPPRPSFLPSTEVSANKSLDSARDMAAYTAYDMMVQQPNLDMLNPMMDDFLNKLSEPMELEAIIGRPAPSLPLVFVGDNAAPSSTMTTNPMFMSPSHRTQQQPESDAYSPILVSPSHHIQQQSDSYSHLSTQQQQQQQQQQIPMQITTEGVHTSPAKDALLQQQPYSGTFSYLSEYQDVAMAEQARYSPSSFLSLTQEQEKGEVRPLLDIQQAGNFALKCEPSMEDQLSVEASSTSDSGFYQQVGLPAGFQQPSQMQVEMGRGNGRGSSGSPEELYRKQQQQQKMLSDGALESVLNQFYQSDQLSANLPRGGLPSRQQQHMQAQGASLGGSFQFPPTAGSPLTSPPPSQQAAQQNRSTAQREVQFVRVSSAGNLPACSDVSQTPARPPLERGKSEPIRHLQDKVRSLSVQHLKQMEELDKQKTIAEVQYSELLMQLLPQTAKPESMPQQVRPEPSDQQQQVLQRVLSDPSLIKILRTVLLSGSQQQTAVNSPPLIAPAPPHLQQQRGGATPPHLQPLRGGASATPPLTQGQQLFGQQQVMSPVDLLSPTEVTMQAGMSDLVSDLQSQVMPDVTQMDGVSSESSSFQLTSGADTSPTQTMIKKFKNSRNLSSSEKEVYREIRRQSHISAEQKRRGSIKHGFDQLQSFVINSSAYPSGKVSKAVILGKTLEHIHKCHVEKKRRAKEMEALKRRIEELNAAIALCQEKLPASGAPVTRQRFEENRQRFAAYVQKRTIQNYKFGIFSIILQQLFESYNSMVSIGTADELCQTVLAWFEQNCTLPTLRPFVMNSMKELTQRTTILSDPSQVPRQLLQYAQESAALDQQQNARSRQQQQTLDAPLYS